MKKSLLLIIGIALQFGLAAQSSIADARAQAVGATVTISGIVTSGAELGTIRYLQDDSAGIALYDYDVSYFQRGDSVSVTGQLTEYANLLEIGNLSAHTVHSSGHPSPTPQNITPNQMSEDIESMLVHIDGVSFADGGSTFASNTSYNFTANGELSSIFVRSNHPLIGSVVPGNEVSIIGLCSQYYANYQLLLRDSADIINPSLINIVSPVTISNISTSGFDISWTTDSTGTTGIIYGNTPNLEIGNMEVPGTSTSHSISISGAAPSELFYIKAYSTAGTDTAFSNITVAITQSLSSGEMIAYFTSTVDVSAATGTDAQFIDDAIDDTLINYIGRATESIDMAIYDFNNVDLSDIAAALNNAYNNGVDVRVIYDTTWSEVPMSSLLDQGIHSVIAPASEDYGIMHNKFVTIDAYATNPDLAYVWTGSTNFEFNNIDKFANNVIILQDKSLAITYSLEFDEMWGSSGLVPDMANSRFGPYKIDNTPHNFIIGGSQVDCYFSPSDRTTSMILKTMETAEDELLIETMLITRSDIAYKIEEVYNAGASLKVIVHDKASCSNTVVNTIEGLIGSDFKEYGESEGMLHNKTMLVDPNEMNSDPTVLTGSHNWSNNAENKNDENTLIIHNASIANQYYQEFIERYNNGIPLHNRTIAVPAERIANLYPNPFNDVLNIVVESAIPEQLCIKIYNIEGKLVQQHTKMTATGKNNIQLDQSGLVNGFYFINLRSNSLNETHKIECMR